MKIIGLLHLIFAWLSFLGVVEASYCLNKKQLIERWGGASKLVAQMLWAAAHRPKLRWLKIVRQGQPGVEVLIDRESADAAYARFRSGEQPPLMPSQKRSRAKAAKIKARKKRRAS